MRRCWRNGRGPEKDAVDMQRTKMRGQDLMARGLVLCVGVLVCLCGCEFFEQQRQPIGYSQDENGRPCATYEIKKDVAYETRCDYGGKPYPSANNPLSEQQPYK